MSGRKSVRPSDARREALMKNDSQLTLSNICQIERYYIIAGKVLAAHQQSYDAGDLDYSYVYGKRFATFVFHLLPEHDYYRSSRPELAQLRRKSQEDAAGVVKNLEKIVTEMDREELEKEKLQKQQEREQLAKRAQEKLRLLGANTTSSKGTVDIFNLPVAPTGIPGTKSNIKQPGPAPAAIEYASLDIPSELPKPIPFAPDSEVETQHSKDGVSNDTKPTAQGPSSDIETLASKISIKDNDSSLPPDFESLFPTQNVANGDVSSNSAVVPSLYPASLDNHSSFSASSSGMSSDSSIPPPQINWADFPHKPSLEKPSRPPPKDKPIPIHELIYFFTQQFMDLRRQNKVENHDLRTYQGRIKTRGRDSTNGCTVISPLVVIDHLNAPGSRGISDGAIETVIDQKAPPILKEVRAKLGLRDDALIIPSDVHDCLVDKKLLSQDQFVGVCGGNILDSNHLGELLKMLGEFNDGKKMGAALFFHEHVVSIIKIVLPNGVCWYDIVDSMPGNNGYATRIRCKAIGYLEIALKWYACRKFTDSDRAYINGNLWDDVLCDFDPRVFQAFVWMQL